LSGLEWNNVLASLRRVGYQSPSEQHLLEIAGKISKQLSQPNATHDGRRIRRTVDGIVGKSIDRNCDNCGYKVPEETRLASQPKCERPIDNTDDACRNFAKWIPNRGIVMSKKGDEKPAKKVTEIKVYPAAQFHIKLSDKMTAQEIKKVEKALEIPFSGVVRIQAFAHRVIITNTLSEDHHEEMKPIFTAAIEKALAN